MKRRVFLRSGAVVAGLLGSLKSFPLSTTTEGSSPNPFRVPNQILNQLHAFYFFIRVVDCNHMTSGCTGT